jgi:metallo-beta-lactamase family protein
MTASLDAPSLIKVNPQLMLKLTFYGAAREVTGSMHLLDCDGVTVALDCGMFQGRRAESETKNINFPMSPATVQAVVLSHAHIDHCGRLPLLVKRGFAGPIFTTPATRDLCALLLADCAHIQSEDARFLNRKRIPRSEPPIEPLYTEADVADTLRLFKTVTPAQSFPVVRNLSCRFYQAGHMLGSSFVRLEHTAGNDSRVSLLFSGDLGRPNSPILSDPDPFPPSDYLLIESTYGGRRHPPNTDLKARLAEIVRATVQRGGKLIIPAFSVGRTQTVVYMLHQLNAEGAIPKIPIYIDSPLAISASEVFQGHPELFDAEATDFQRIAGALLKDPSVHYVREAEESKKLNAINGSCVIISASGMCENGRIVHHIRNNVQDPKNTILIVGFQAAHTLGRRLVERQPHVTIFGQELKVRANIEICNGFSGHADSDELEKMYKPLAPKCRAAFLVHGEPDQMEKMSATMRADGFSKVLAPAPGESFTLS